MLHIFLCVKVVRQQAAERSIKYPVQAHATFIMATNAAAPGSWMVGFWLPEHPGIIINTVFICLRVAPRPTENHPFALGNSTN